MSTGFTPVFLPAGTGSRAGAVPNPGASSQPDYYLRADATWGALPGTGIPPPLPGESTNANACRIAGYLVNTFVQEAVDVAIAESLGGPSAFTWVSGILNALPWVGPWLGNVSDGIGGGVKYIATVVGVDWLTVAAEIALWNLIGCTVYQGVLGIGGFTTSSLAAVCTALRALPGPAGYLGSLVASILEDTTAAALNGMLALAADVSYDCSGCTAGNTGGSGPVQTGPTGASGVIGLTGSFGLWATDDTTTVKQVGVLEMPDFVVSAGGATLTGNLAHVRLPTFPDGCILSVNPTTHKLYGLTGSAGALPYFDASGHLALLPVPS